MAVVATRPHPFRLQRVVHEVQAGATVHEILDLVLPGSHDTVVVSLDGRLLDSAEWDIAPPAGAYLTVTIRPGSGAAMRSVLTLAIVVAAAVAAPYIVGGLGITTAAGFSAATVSGATAATAMALSTAGMLALNALVPPTEIGGSGGKKSKVWSLDRASNDIRLYSAIPRVLGRHRYTPPLAAEVYPESQDKRAWIRFAVCWGYGPVVLSDFRFGDTPVDAIPGVEMQHFLGTPGVAASLSLYSDDISVTRVDGEITNAGGPFIRRSSSDVDEVIVQLAFPRGLADMREGEADKLGVEYKIEYAPVSTGTWTTLVQELIKKATTAPIYKSYRIVTSEQIDVRVTRITRDRKDLAKVDGLVWSTLISIKHTNPFLAKGVAVTAVRVQAGEQASGSLDALSAIVESEVLDWNGSAWVLRVTRNPASLARAVLQAGGNARPLPDDQLDLGAFAAWHDYCSQRGLTCDLVVDWDGATVEQVLQLVAATGDAIVLPLDGVWRPVIDRVQSTPVQLLTPRNVRSMRWRRIRAEQPHGLRVRFIDAAADYTRAERVVYADGYGPSNAARLDDFELPGITDAGLVYRHARRRLAELRLRQETYELELDWEFLACQVGDRVELAHDTILAAVGWGRVRSVALSGGQCVSVELDETINRSADTSYGATIRGVSGIQTHTLTSTDTPSSIVTFETPLSTPPALGDLVTVGELGQVTLPALVTRIRPGPDLTATVECTTYHPGVYTADTEEIPPWNPYLSGVALDAPIIRDLWRDPLTGEVVVELAPHGRPLTAVAIELSTSEDLDAEATLTSWPPDTLIARYAAARGTVIVRARFRLSSTTTSAWSPAAQLVDAANVPPDVIAAWLDGEELVWRSVASAIGYRVRYGAVGVAWENASPAHESLLTGTRWSARNLPISAGELLIVAVSLGDAVSRTPYRVPWARHETVGAFWPIATYSPRDAGWPGFVEGVRDARGVSGSATGKAFPDPSQVAFKSASDPAFPDAWASAAWTYRLDWTVPETGQIGDLTIAVSTEDVLLIRPALETGIIYSAEYDWHSEGDSEPFSDGRYFADGRGWLRVSSLPWLAWPRQMRADPGKRLRIRLRGAGTMSDLTIQVARPIKIVHSARVVVPVTGITIAAPVEAVAVIAAHATPISANTIVRAAPVTGGTLIETVGLDGTAREAVVSVTMEVI